MDKPGYTRGAVLTGLLLAVCPVLASAPSIPVRINNYVIPAYFASALQQGMTVPVFIRYAGEEIIGSGVVSAAATGASLLTHNAVSDKKNGDNAASMPASGPVRSRQKIADAVVSVRDGRLVISQLTLSEQPDRTALAPYIQTLLEEVKNRELDGNNRLALSSDASISLDTRSFYLEMVVSKDAMTAAILPRSSLLGASTAKMLSGILNYTFGSYYSKFGQSHNTSNYLTLDSTTALREHHLNVNGSFYGLGTSNKSSELYRAMYERDYEGHRVAVGMVDTWNLQSIANMSALSSSRIYGASYGNKSSTLMEDNTLSLVPITVFLPAAGEVHITREDRLLSIQNFPMGSFEIDTAKLPFGVYDVDIQVVVNGKVVNTRTAQINKTFSRSSSVTDSLAWQLFSGLLEYNRTDYRDKRNLNYGKKETWLAGLALSITRPWLSGVGLKSTVYGFDRNAISESEISVAFNDILKLNQQVLVANDGTVQGTSTLNLSVPGGYANIWASRKFGYVGDRLPVSQGGYFSAGFSVNLNRFSPWLGSLSVSRNNDKYNGSAYTNVDYSQTLFSGRYGTVSMKAGLQRYQYSSNDSRREKYINFDISLPLSSWVSAGVSSENGSLLANASVRKRFDDSVITQTGVSMSKQLKSRANDNSYQTGDFSASGYASYDSKYSAGTVSVSRGSSGSRNVSLSSQGSLAWTPASFNLGKGGERSGVVINTGFSDSGQMLAQINGSNYPLTGKSNFISLPPYAEYKVELMNDKNSEDSVDIVSGRSSKAVLYPGNVDIITPEVKQLVTVFGRVCQPDGAALARIDIHNHIGKTRTDDEGEFAMDVDRRYPVITLIDKQGGVCEADLDLSEARGAIWVGDIQCEPQKKMASLKGDSERA